MATLRTQYINFIKSNPNVKLTYDDWFQHVYNEQFNIMKTEREIDLIKTLDNIKIELSNIKYNNGDISDLGNEIGYALGKTLNNLNEVEISTFIMGLKHGISLTNETH